MAHIALIIFACLAGFAIYSGDIPLNRIVEEQLLWAALLPAVYLIGMSLLRERD